MKEISAGGVCIHDNHVLILKKYYGEWVLPKGRCEENEDLQQTALREVKEETGIDCIIHRYIGYIRYNYRGKNGEMVKKTVHYFYMGKKEGELNPQNSEGFKTAAFIECEKAIELLKHYAEKNMVQTAVQWHLDGNIDEKEK